MSQPYVGEIRMGGFNFAPNGWAFCDGSLMSISQNSTLFNLIGTTYGGDGQTTFAMPNLLGRMPVHISGTYPIGASGGQETVALISNQTPGHTHVVNASTGSSSNSPSGAIWGATSSASFAPAGTGALQPMNAAAVASAGSGQGHENMMPFQAITFVISLFGVYPSQN